MLIHSLTQWEPVERHPSVTPSGLQPPLHLPQKCLLLGWFLYRLCQLFCVFLLCETNDLIHILFVLWVYTFLLLYYSYCSVAKLCLTLQPHGLQHTRLPCPLPVPQVCSNSCLVSQWCHPTISSSVVPFSSPQSFSAPGSFPVSQLFESGGQNTGASASASVLSMNIQSWFPLGFTGLISLQSKDLSRVFSSSHNSKPLIL